LSAADEHARLSKLQVKSHVFHVYRSVKRKAVAYHERSDVVYNEQFESPTLIDHCLFLSLETRVSPDCDSNYPIGLHVTLVSEVTFLLHTRPCDLHDPVGPKSRTSLVSK
jgi:hypothetical protein